MFKKFLISNLNLFALHWFDNFDDEYDDADKDDDENLWWSWLL